MGRKKSRSMTPDDDLYFFFKIMIDLPHELVDF